MLVIGHLIAFLIFRLAMKRVFADGVRIETLPKVVRRRDSDPSDEEEFLINQESTVPMSLQRYRAVRDLISKWNVQTELEKLVDFGCGNFSLFCQLKDSGLEQVLFVDIDEDLLRDSAKYVRPLLYDHLNRRPSPLEVSIFRGSIIEPDRVLEGVDVVTAIELIEHLYPDTLDALPYNVFSYANPKLVIISTPNADFNVVFEKKTDEFRHPDHKFEWSRAQFRDWARNVVQRFPQYEVDFEDVGQFPHNFTSDIGLCSQIAVFYKKDFSHKAVVVGKCTCQESCKQTVADDNVSQCDCVCSLCQPDFSVGVCTYFSHNIDSNEAYRPMKMKMLHKKTSDQPYFSLYLLDDNCGFKCDPSSNIFYKLIEKIEYPFRLVTPEDQKERLLNTLKYRVSLFNNSNTVWYLEDKELCQVPVSEILWGDDVRILPDEAAKLLLTAGYCIEKCQVGESDRVEDCIILDPWDRGNDSDSTEGYG